LIIKMLLSKKSFAMSNEVHGHLIHDEFDVRVTKHSRLLCKVMVFKSAKKMRKFIRAHGGRIQSDAVGRTDTIDPSLKSCYFAFIHIPMNYPLEVVAHEAVHAGFEYGRRVGKSRVFASPGDQKEENVCYPAGRITQAIWTRIQSDMGRR